MSIQQDRFLEKHFGIFNHYLYGMPGDDALKLAGREGYDWNEAVESVDVNDLAERIHKTGAGYYCITIMQGSKYMLAPNETYDKIAGTVPGEACAKRNIITELADALEKYGIDLFLYYTGDGPHADQVIGKKFGYADPRGQVTMDFVEKWAAVLEEYAVKYGRKIKGWWIDGCYREYFGYTPELLKPYYDAIKKGNPDALVAMNNGIKPDYIKYYPDEDFVCGEYNDFTVLPKTRFVDGAQTHILAPLGISGDGSEYGRWRRPGLNRDKEYMIDFVKRANEIGMPVTIDIFVNSAGKWDGEQFDCLCKIGEAVNK